MAERIVSGLTIKASAVHDAIHRYAVDSVGSDAYAITPFTTLEAYAGGQMFSFKAGTANTGACTLNVNGKGAKAIKKNVTLDLETGDILVNQIVTVIYDSVADVFQMVGGVVDQSVLSLTAEEDLTAGQTVGISNYAPASSVGRANRRNPSITTSFTGSDVIKKPSLSVPIGGDKFVFISMQTSDDSLYATVGSINRATKEITLGTSSAVTADIQNSVELHSVCKLGTDKFIVFYIEDASATIIKYRVGTVSGTTISWGSATTFYTSATSVGSIDSDFISTDKGIVFVGCSATPTDSRLIAFTVSSTTATAGTPASVGTTLDDDTQSARVKKVATDKFVVMSRSKRAQCGTLSGTTITLGSEATNPTSVAMNNFVDIVSPADNVAVATYRDGSNIGEIIAMTISGTTITFGTQVVMNQYDNNLYAESASSILVVNDTDDGIRKYTLSGTTLTSVGYVIKLMSGNPSRILPIDNGYWCAINHSSTTFRYFIQGMSNMFHGIVENTVSRGGTARVRILGVNSNQSGLIAGRMYQPDGAGGLSAINSNVTLNTGDDRFVTALSATQVLIGNY